MHTMMTVVCTTLMLGAAALVLAPALADEEAHAHCSNSSCSSMINSSALDNDGAYDGANALGWRVNETYATAACNMPILDANELPPGALAQRLATATTPLLITGMLDSQLPGWRAQAAAYQDASRRASVGVLLVRLNEHVDDLFSTAL